MNISIIQPSRNNLKYLQWSYKSIRKNQGEHTVQICVADDFSDDGTWEWCSNTMKHDPNFDAIRNDGPARVGHTILYDRLVNEVAKFDLCMIYHADMYLCPGALDAIERLMYGVDATGDDVDRHLSIFEQRKRIVSLTRIEPPLHPPGPEKVVKDFGTEPEEFDEDSFLEFLKTRRVRYDVAGGKVTGELECTEGVFAPWAFWKSDFQEIGGHDPLFAPQSKEDSDIFNRFQLNGIKFLQTWEGFVYHMTCRGSRFNPTLTTVGTNSTEWEQQNQRSARNFVRKWGSYVKHDKYMKPIIPHKYDVGIVMYNTSIGMLSQLEPWCSVFYSNLPQSECDAYIKHEQPNTLYNLRDRVKCGIDDTIKHDVIVRITGKFDHNDVQYIQMLSDIIDDSGEPNSTMRIGNLELVLGDLIPLEDGLIRVNK